MSINVKINIGLGLKEIQQKQNPVHFYNTISFLIPRKL